MLYQLLVSIFIFIAFLLAIVILIQQSKGNMGLGNLGGSTQMIFGGSGGQEFMQKLTWVLATLFMGGSLLLSIMRSGIDNNAYTAPEPRQATEAAAPAQPAAPTAPANMPAPAQSTDAPAPTI